MLTKLDTLYIAGRNKIHQAVDGFKTRHEGLSGIIVAVGLILIAIIIVMVFYNTLKSPIEGSIEATGDRLESLTGDIAANSSSAGGTQ